MQSLDDVIRKMENFSLKSIENEVHELFEPIVYQIVLLTRMDTGTGRASIGYPFTQNVINSARIIKAIKEDVEMNSDSYDYWSSKDPFTEYEGGVISLVESNKIQVVITSNDEGVINQNQGENMSSAGATTPSSKHPRLNPQRHIPYHIDVTGMAISHGSVDLENLDDNFWYPEIKKDIKIRLKRLYKKVEKELFG